AATCTTCRRLSSARNKTWREVAHAPPWDSVGPARLSWSRYDAGGALQECPISNQSAGPSKSLTASRSEASSAAEASSRSRASASRGTPGTIDQAAPPFEARGKL